MDASYHNKCDADNDGYRDYDDKCPTDRNKHVAGKCGCHKPETDYDGDNICMPTDKCPNDKNKLSPGLCGCGKSDKDSDGDKTADCLDKCPTDPEKLKPGVCGCGNAETDFDNDKICATHDECPNDPLKQTKGICPCGEPNTDSDGTDRNRFLNSIYANQTVMQAISVCHMQTDRPDKLFYFAYQATALWIARILVRKTEIMILTETLCAETLMRVR